MDIDKLKVILAVDHPTTGAWNADDALAAVQANVKDVSRNRASMTGQEVAEEVVESEYIALTDPKKAQFLALASTDSINPFGLAAKVIKDIFGAGSATVTVLVAARVELVSVATDNGLGTIKTGHVFEARK